jgi:hypothetical protein
MAGTVDEAGGAAVELAALLTVIGTVVLVWELASSNTTYNATKIIESQHQDNILYACLQHW